ncbi:hypothetical protein [Natrialba sp. INN-245]|uniref:hypothetical protein n=1 Tax=Natrialba sp. INN-245 TaxID=2690967 RepID=UPI001311CFD2|nr:hypothetical protein [Natrialba sp. INN-245]MWV39404.1 hypothetical protein [Natrialba sp. INN-245]
MSRSAARRVRDRFDPGTVVVAVLVVAALSLLGLEVSSTDVVRTVVAVAVITPLFGYLLERSGVDIDLGLLVIALGVVVGWGGYGHLQDGIGWLGWLGWLLLVLGGWLCLEGLDRFVRDDGADDAGGGRTDDVRATADETDDLSRAELAELNECNRRLVGTLRDADRPLSADEIRSRANLTPGEFDRLLEIHDESGPIDRVGTGYTLDEREMGLTGILRTIGRRLLRPVRVLRPGRRA